MTLSYIHSSKRSHGNTGDSNLTEKLAVETDLEDPDSKKISKESSHSTMAMRPAATATAAPSLAPSRNLHLVWHGTPFSLYECKLACALAIHVCFEDKTPLDHITIGKVIGAASGLKGMNCEGLVDHLRQTNDVYPEVAGGGYQWGDWAQNAWNMWLDPEAAAIGTWP